MLGALANWKVRRSLRRHPRARSHCTRPSCQFLLLFGLNQCGSLLYAYLLGTAGAQLHERATLTGSAPPPPPPRPTDPTLAVPVSNTFTFVFTVLAAAVLGETSGVGACAFACRPLSHTPPLTPPSSLAAQTPWLASCW